MINLQTEQHAMVVGLGSSKDCVQQELRQQRCVCCNEPLYLCDDEILTDFVVLDPRSAQVNTWLLVQIARAQPILSGQQIALIRWKDETESLVVFPVGDAVPTQVMLMAAYGSGYAVEKGAIFLSRSGTRHD